MKRSALALAALLALAPLAPPASVPAARADEGMWTFDNLPLERLQERYGFTPTPAWAEHLQRSAVNFGGGSGAFVSPDGLVLTNHHVALNQLAKMSGPGRDHIRDGFFARSRGEELRCPDLELKVLWSMEDVTARAIAAVDPEAPPARQAEQRKAALARLEQESAKRTGLKTETVELYQGGQYWLYRYRTFEDVRLVCAPEEQMAFFGGDPDNFSFPRHDLDFAFFRVYEDGKPAKPEHWLRWGTAGVKEGDLVMVVGHPGRTGRQRTVAQLAYERDVDMPERIRINERRLEAYRAYAALGSEQARQTVQGVRGLTNNLKRQRGFLEVLRDPDFAAARQATEDALRARVAADPRLREAYGDAWDRIAAAQRERATAGRAQMLRETFRVSRLVDFANTLVRLTAEVEKPNERRLREYREGNLPSLRFQLLSPAPVYPAMEEAVFGAHLRMALEGLGPDDPWVKAALAGGAPAEVAHALLSATALGDPAERRRLLEGGRRAVEASRDPLLVWARRMDALYREWRAWMEERVESVESAEGARIARARFALEGTEAYPDATGTLRLSYGKVAGYEQMSTEVPAFTTFHGLYDRSLSFGGRPPFDLPARVADARGRIDLATPLDFVSTDDSIGGNSGSPVVDREGRYVGLVFDGNIQSFLWDYGWSDARARCVSVDARALVVALRDVYGMGALADELLATAR